MTLWWTSLGALSGLVAEFVLRDAKQQSVLDSLAGKLGEFQSISDEHIRLLSYRQLEAVLLCVEWLAKTDKSLHNEARRAAKGIRGKLA